MRPSSFSHCAADGLNADDLNDPYAVLVSFPPPISHSTPPPSFPPASLSNLGMIMFNDGKVMCKKSCRGKGCCAIDALKKVGGATPTSPKHATISQTDAPTLF